MSGIQLGVAAVVALNEPLDPATYFFSFWEAFTKILGIGSTAAWGTQLINTLYWAIGIAISGAVIGFISAQIIRAVAKLQEGKSAVIESGHTLILGWSNRVFPILSELAIANENVRKPRVVIFAPTTRAIMDAEKNIESALRKGAYRTFLLQTDINSRQRKVLDLLVEGFSGKLTSSKYAKIAKCSADTALRDIKNLLSRDFLSQEKAGGRSTAYTLQSSSLQNTHPN
jgi:hypothetical protein